MMWNRLAILSVLVGAVLFGVVTACDGPPSVSDLEEQIAENDSEGDPESSAADGDTDGDGDGDTDGDSDSDSDGDADGDTDGDADGDSDGDADSDVDSDGDADGDADGDSDGDADGDTDGDADGDSDGDSDGDTDIEGIGNPCTVSVNVGMPINIKGTCQVESFDCEGGWLPPEYDNPEACGNDLLSCCINTNQCAASSFGMGKCQAEECPADAQFGFQAGCPDYGYCCVSFGGGMPGGIL